MFPALTPSHHPLSAAFSNLFLPWNLSFSKDEVESEFAAIQDLPSGFLPNMPLEQTITIVNNSGKIISTVSPESPYPPRSRKMPRHCSLSMSKIYDKDIEYADLGSP